jgi:ribonucleoside-triphosphate reductase
MYNFRVVKRNGRVQEFDKTKIKNAILQSMKFGSGIYKPAIADAIADEIESYYVEKFKDKINPYMQNNIEMSDIETRVFEKLVAKKQKLTAKAYEGYRAIQEFKRQYTTLDKDIEGIVDGTNKDAIDENSNKNSYIASTQRDLIAGEYSRDYSRRHLLPENILHAHDEGMIHMHDLDYFIQHTHNCCLVNLKDMLQNGTVINRKLIEKPHTLRTACTIATQIVQQIANGQYGGQTISLSHLAPFVRISYERYYNKYIERGESEENARKFAEEDTKSEIKDGIQTIQYQINTFSTSNGQAPFLSVFMYISEEPEYEKETAMLIEEMLNQRITGMKNEVGAYITPAFPKLLYVTDENNIYPGSEYYYLTELAAKCVSKRMLPDFISAKIMREQYDGEVFPCMGCRSFLQPYKDPKTNQYKWYGRFNQGVVTLNLADVGLSADKDIESFWSILDERLELCFQALMLRHERLLNTSVNISPIHWKYGGLSRLSTDNFNELLFNDYSSISLGYAGLYECVKSLTGKSHTTKEGKALGLEIMKYLKETCDKWRKETNIGFSLYGTPLESTTYKLAKCLKKRFGDDVFIKLDGQDRDYITNSYHVNVAEEIEAKDKLLFEAEFQKYSSGGCISYVETCNLSSNIDVILDLIQFMYENIRYAELNGKFDYCQECGYEGEILLDDNNQWYCPNCGNRNHNTMNVARRTCGYIGDNFWNEGRTDEIKNRYVHVDNKEANIELDEE